MGYNYQDVCVGDSLRGSARIQLILDRFRGEDGSERRPRTSLGRWSAFSVYRM